MHETVPEPRARIIHPFAYGASTSIPFAAVHDDYPPQDTTVPPLPAAQHTDQGRESEVMSRGAGLKSMYHAAGALLRSSKTEGGGSADGGTFGMLNSKNGSPRKAAVSI